MTVQAKTDTRIRTALTDAAQAASDQINSLASNSTFSAGVRTAQLRLVMGELQSVHKDFFGKLIPIIQNGQQDEAGAAFDALSATDINYLHSAFSETGDVNSFLKSQRVSAMLHVNNAIQRITKTDRPLSARVYSTQSLANRWVQNVINRNLARGSSAKEIAKQVKRHILPSTPGGTSYAALRLGRTELNNAFHATAIDTAQNRPWVTGMRWYLSDTHHAHPNRVEVCERLAGQLFDLDLVPGKPHPQCRCFVVPEVEAADVFLRHLTAGQYRSWMESNVNKAS